MFLTILQSQLIIVKFYFLTVHKATIKLDLVLLNKWSSKYYIIQVSKKY